MNPFLPWPTPNSDEVEEGHEATEEFAGSETPVQVSATEQNAELSTTTFQQNQPTTFSTVHSSSAGQASTSAVHTASAELPPTAVDVPLSRLERHSSTGAIPKTFSGPKRSDAIPTIESPSSQSDESKLFWEDTGAIPKYLTKEYAQKAPKYLPPFKKANAPKPKRGPTKLPEMADILSSPTSESSAELPKEPTKERRSSRSERAQFVRQHCLDFQDYKRTVNNKQKGLEQSLNLVLPKMNSAMVDAQKLANKIEVVRSQVCDTHETLKIQNDKMKYLVGRTVGTIAKIDVLFDRFRTDILDYTTLTTEGNDGIDTRLSRLLKILCGLEDKELQKEKNKEIRDAFSE